MVLTRALVAETPLVASDVDGHREPSRRFDGTATSSPTDVSSLQGRRADRLVPARAADTLVDSTSEDDG